MQVIYCSPSISVNDLTACRDSRDCGTRKHAKFPTGGTRTSGHYGSEKVLSECFTDLRLITHNHVENYCCSMSDIAKEHLQQINLPQR